MRRGYWLTVLCLAVLPRCSDTTAPSPVLVTVTATPTAALPGQYVQANISVVPPSNAEVDYVRILTSGVLTSSESLDVHLRGTFTATRLYHLPLNGGTGTFSVLATAEAGGGIGNGQAEVVVADTSPPNIQLVVTPTDSVEPGDSLIVTLSAGDNVALRYSLIRLSGPMTLTDSIDASLNSFVSRTLRLRVPPTAASGTLQITAQVEDIGDHVVSTAAHPLSLHDTRPPVVLATLRNSRGTPGFQPGDTLILSLAARDNAQLQMVGYQFGAPASVQDSFPATDTLFNRSVKFVVPQAWTGTSTYAVIARDATGNARQELLGTFTVANRTRQAPWAAALDASVRDMALDTKRNLLYLSEPDSGRVAVLSLDSRAFSAPYAFPGASLRGLDVTLGGDSLLVANRSSPYVIVLDLVTGQRDTIRVNSDNFLNRGPDNLRVMGNNKVLVTITFDGSGYGGSLVELDLGNRMFTNKLTVTELVPLCRSADRSTALILIDDSCCPIEGVVYDALTSSFPADRGTVSQYFNISSADYIGSHFLISGTLFDRDLNSLGSETPVGGTSVSVLSPDGTAAYFATATGVTRVRLSDGAIVDSIPLSAQPYKLAISPDGLSLFAATPTQLYAIDLW